MTARSKVLSQADVRVSEAPVRVGESPLAVAAALAGATSATTERQPEVSVEHDAAGQVSRIHIRCQCGEEITVCCEYPEAA